MKQVKQIVMLQGMGNNERGWAALVSKFGRVVLVQQGLIDHVEIWQEGRCAYKGPEEDLRRFRTLDEIMFGFLTAVRSIKHCYRFSEGREIDLIISTNYCMGLSALLLRKIGKTHRVVCLLSDYMPINGSFAIRTYRSVTRYLTRFVVKHADEVWTVSPRIPTANANRRNLVLPICIDDNHMLPGQREEIGYIGFPSPDHALDVLFDICKRHHFRLNIIGDSAYLQSIKHLAPPHTVFHGMLNDPARINNILSRCFCGYAVYRDTGPQSYSYFGIPSKTFYYFASNTPVITTNAAHFTQHIEEYGIGRVINPTPEEIEKAVLELKERFQFFYEAINRFREIWNAKAEQFHRERLAVLCEK
jgi:glycosyltransferase involved in cell wall biosynthesis